MIKRLIDTIITGLCLVCGYALLSILVLAVAVGIGLLTAELIGRTIVEPSFWIIVADIAFVAIIGYVTSRKRFRVAMAELWKQIRRNL